MRNIVVLKGDREKSIGLIGMSPIPPDTFYVFEDVRPGTLFHSRGVLEPFDIAFLDAHGRPIVISEVTPPEGLITAPLGTRKVIESKAGYLRGLMGMGADDHGEIAKGAALPIMGALIGAGIVTITMSAVKHPILKRLLIGAGGVVSILSFAALIRNATRNP